MKDVREAQMVGRNTEGRLIRRPISPFMLGTAYRLQMSSVTSFAHRLTGCALGAGTLLLTLWLVTAASDNNAFLAVQGFLASWIGILILIGFTLSLFYHTCNGLRHLGWDMGRGFGLPTMHRTGWLVFAATIILTAAFWLIGFWVW